MSRYQTLRKTGWLSLVIFPRTSRLGHPTASSTTCTDWTSTVGTRVARNLYRHILATQWFSISFACKWELAETILILRSPALPRKNRPTSRVIGQIAETRTTTIADQLPPSRNSCRERVQIYRGYVTTGTTLYASNVLWINHNECVSVTSRRDEKHEIHARNDYSFLTLFLSWIPRLTVRRWTVINLGGRSSLEDRRNVFREEAGQSFLVQDFALWLRLDTLGRVKLVEK